VGPELSALALRERLLTAPVAALPVRATDGQLVGVVTASTLGERWSQVESGATVATLAELARPVSQELSVGEVLALMEARGVDALPVEGEGRVGVVTRVGLERFLVTLRKAARTEPAFVATELPR